MHAESGNVSFFRRLVRDFGTTMWRGLLITFPSGFYLQHREYQFGWTYAVAGAAMPVQKEDLCVNSREH